MTTALIRILLVEDNPSDAELLQQALERSGVGRFEFTWVECLADALSRVGQEPFDVLLLDLSLPDSSGPETFRRAQSAAQHLPILVLTGAQDERLALAAVQEGVQDYLVKGQADGRQIARAIRYAIERKQAEEQLRHQNEILAGINRIFREALTCQTEEQLGRSCLAVLEEVTASRFGFIAEINAAGRLNAIAISNPGWDACRMDPETRHEKAAADFRVRGVYGRVILNAEGFITNDLASHPDSVGLPAGHRPVHAFLGVPLTHAARTIGMIGLANREGGYRKQDLEACQALTPAIVQVFLHKRAEQERERLVEKLRESIADSDRNRAQLEAVLQGMQDGVIVFDMDGQARFVNEAEATIIGFRQMDAIGQGLDYFASRYELFHMDGRPVPSAEWPVSRVLRGESITDWELRGKRRGNGREWVFCFSGEPAYDGKGKQILGVVITRDVTERTQAEERLRRAQKLESIGILAGGVAHDFNNILTAIMGNASLARLEASPEVGERLDRIVTAAERAAALTRQLLAYAGKGQFEITDFDLSRVIRSSTDLIRVSVPKDVGLVMRVPRDLPLMRGDPAQIQQVVMNLVMNAAEAVEGRQSGTVWIGAAVAEIGSDAPSTPGLELAPGPHVCLEVRDNGCGMDEPTKARIFDPFFTTKFTGRGLGLAAVQGILRAHKGAIAVQSQPGEGSTFTVYLPCVGLGTPKEAARLAATGRRRSATVLVVDDERDIRIFARAALQRLGHNVLLADNGFEALEILRTGPAIDLVLLDVLMPVIGGGEALAEIRRQWPDISILVTSGYNREEARRLGTIPGDLPFIEKPFTLEKLATAIENVLESRSAV